MNKKGISNIIMAVIMLVLVLVTVGIVWKAVGLLLNTHEFNITKEECRDIGVEKIIGSKNNTFYEEEIYFYDWEGAFTDNDYFYSKNFPYFVEENKLEEYLPKIDECYEEDCSFLFSDYVYVPLGGRTERIIGYKVRHYNYTKEVPVYEESYFKNCEQVEVDEMENGLVNIYCEFRDVLSCESIWVDIPRDEWKPVHYIDSLVKLTPEYTISICKDINGEINYYKGDKYYSYLPSPQPFELNEYLLNKYCKIINETISKQDLTTNWLDENCEKEYSEVNKYKCSDYLVEVIK